MKSNGEPAAYLITFRCYGTWLHGDERGSVSRHGDTMPGEPGVAVSPAREAHERDYMRSPPVSFATRNTREAVLAAIREAADYRGWVLDAVNVRTNHVHVLVAAGPGGPPPERMLNDFKAYSTRRLRRTGLAAESQPIWSRHGSTRWLWTVENVATARAYVLDAQGEDLGAVFDRERA